MGRKGIPDLIRNYVAKRDKDICQYCRRDLSKESFFNITLDHIKPYSEGGSNHPMNLVLSCRSCNNKKGIKGIVKRDILLKQLHEINKERDEILLKLDRLGDSHE
jgi:5-methylcytosine-specific restriction endonuclease McrA